MEFEYTADEQAFRAEVRQFIAENLTPEVVAEAEAGGPRPLLRAMQKKMMDRGWVRLALPKEYGGQGGDLTKQFIVDEEFSRAGVQTGHNYGSGYFTIIKYGTEEQRQYYIPRMLSGEIRMDLGYTEPSGGTDLAGLRTRAVRDGDSYVINGQKMYGGSQSTTHMYLLARTDTKAERHAGLSMFLVPMDLPGVTFRPLRLIKDRTRPFAYCGKWAGETFYEDVRVPLSARLGNEGDGWKLATTGLAIDRIGITRFLRSAIRTDHIIDFVNAFDLGGFSPKTDPVIRDKLAELWIERQVYRLMTMRSLQMVKRDLPMVHESPAEKIWGPEHNVRAIEAIAQILGPYMQLLGGEFAPRDGEFGDHLMVAWLVGIGHGSVQAMRDQIARRALGLPRS
jgi:alkylation response protein AidB-like acyl-CoA dehydrogenase